MNVYISTKCTCDCLHLHAIYIRYILYNIIIYIHHYIPNAANMQRIWLSSPSPVVIIIFKKQKKHSPPLFIGSWRLLFTVSRASSDCPILAKLNMLNTENQQQTSCALFRKIMLLSLPNTEFPYHQHIISIYIYIWHPNKDSTLIKYNKIFSKVL